MTHPFEQQLLCHGTCGDWSDVTVLLAVSGGADSMSLLRAALATRASGTGKLVVLHYNHHLRGEESDADESFVREQCGQFGLPCEVAQSPRRNPSSNEESARRERYDFFSRMAGWWGARYVATAHTLNDQAETILHRVFRGTGLAGLAGIPRVRELLPGVSLIRPLLAATRSQVLDYLHSIGQPFCQDLSNAESRFTRNRLRNELIPLLERDYNSHVQEAVCRLGQLAGEAQGAIESTTRNLRQQAIQSAGPRGAAIRCAGLKDVHPYLVRQLFIEVWRECGWGVGSMAFEHWNQLADLAKHPAKIPSRINLPGAVTAESDGTTLKLLSGADPLD